MAYPNEIASIRKARNMSQTELAERIGSTLSMLGKLERGDRRLNQDWMGRIAKALSVEPYQLIAPQEVGRETAAFILEGALPVKAIPLLGEVPAGPWREAIQTAHHYIPAPAPGMPDSAFALELVGNSMNKIATEGATIIIDPSDRDLFDKWLYVVRNGDGEVTFKQYRENPARLVPCSTDPSHQIIPLANRDYEILGRVIWIAMRPDQAALD